MKTKTLSDKIELLNFIFIIIGLIGYSLLTKNWIQYIRRISEILLGISALFIVTVLLRNVIAGLKKLNINLKKNLKREIEDSIQKEHKEKDYAKKAQVCRDRAVLYTQTTNFNISKSLGISFISLFICMILTYAPNVEIFNILDFIYVLFIYGVFHLLKILIIFLELINKEEFTI